MTPVVKNPLNGGGEESSFRARIRSSVPVFLALPHQAVNPSATSRLSARQRPPRVGIDTWLS